MSDFSGNSVELVSFDELERSSARNKIIALERGRLFPVELVIFPKELEMQPVLISILTQGKKKSKEGTAFTAIERENLDVQIHYSGQLRKLNYIDDLLVDSFVKKTTVSREMGSVFAEDFTKAIVSGVRQSIELTPLAKIMESLPVLLRLETARLPGHPLRLMLATIKYLGLQEDVNYWGKKPNKKEAYEGRYKPLHALEDLLVKRTYFKAIIRKHRLSY